MKSQKTVDWFLIIVFNFMWATQVPVIRLIGDRLSAITIAFIPMIISTIIFLPILWIQYKKGKVHIRWRWSEIKHFFAIGLIGIFLMQYAYTVGARLTLAANAGIITLAIPIMVAIFASFILNEKLNFVRIISFILAIIGVLFTSISDISGANFHIKYLTGNLVFLFACFCCAFYNTYSKILIDKNYTELEILVYGSIIGSIASIPVLIWVEPFHISELLNSGEIAIGGILELSIFVYGVPMLLFFYVLKRMDVSQAILGNYLLPFFIALLGIVLLNESISLVMIIGGSIVFISTLMITVFENEIMAYFGRFKNRNKELIN